MFVFAGLNARVTDRLALFTLLLFSVLALTSCDLAANYTKGDRAANANIQDYRDALNERMPEIAEEDSKDGSSGSIPELQPYVAMNTAGLKSMPLVSVSVNQTVPLRDILFELAEQAEYDLELDPSIRGSIIFTARNQPFDVVIERISKVAGLRYRFEEGFLRVELDTPYIKTYKIDYLSFVRSNSGGVNADISVVSGEGADTGSNFQATSESSSDFWAELELNLDQLLGGQSTGALKTNRDPRITAVEQNPDVEAVAPEEGTEGGVEVQAPEVVLNVESLPIDDGGEDPSAGGGSEGGATYSLNKQAGLINVYAPERIHNKVQEYLDELKNSVTSQVLIEAKVFEVSLSDEYINGIEWQAFQQSGEAVLRFVDATPLSLIGAISQPGGSVATIQDFGIGYLGDDVSVFVDALSGFGTVRALASPRLTVLNNQSAVLNVATNRVYFEIDIDRETDDDTNTTTVEIDSNIRSVPEGVLINVQPSINLENRTVSMFVRPTVTRIVNTVSDPGVLFVAGDTGIESNIPEVNVQEIDTVIRVNSGQPIVMGGLLQDRMNNTNESVPVLGEVPVVGNLFKTQRDLVQKTELVIFLKATILEAEHQTIHNTDRDLYRAFAGDRRPFKL